MRSLTLSLARALIVAGLFGFWELISRIGLVNPRLLPPASDVLNTLWEIIQRPALQADLLVTASEALIAFAIAVPVSILIGLALAESKYLGDTLKPILFFVFSIPKSIFLPMFILVFGITFYEKVAFGIFSTIFILIMSTTAAVDSVRAEHVTAARSFGATRSQIVRRVYLPSMLPVVLEALRLAMIFNFTGIILAEMYASRSGLGHLISDWGENFMLRRLLAGVLLVSVIAILFNECIRWVEKRCSHWRTA